MRVHQWNQRSCRYRPLPVEFLMARSQCLDDGIPSTSGPGERRGVSPPSGGAFSNHTCWNLRQSSVLMFEMSFHEPVVRDPAVISVQQQENRKSNGFRRGDSAGEVTCEQGRLIGECCRPLSLSECCVEWTDSRKMVFYRPACCVQSLSAFTV